LEHAPRGDRVTHGDLIEVEVRLREGGLEDGDDRGGRGGDPHDDVDVVRRPGLTLEARGHGAGDHAFDPGRLQSAGDELQ
jgi:hypothetical protein